MKIVFIKDFVCSNFKKIQADEYKKGQEVEIFETVNGFDPKTMISKEMANIAKIHRFADNVKEFSKTGYENKLIVPKSNKKKVVKISKKK